MSSRIIIDGNAIYEVDEECLRKKKEKEQEEEHESNRRSAKTKHKKRRGYNLPRLWSV